MTYEQTIDFIFEQLPMFQRQGKVAYKANLNNTIAFDTFLNHPHRTFQTIHVAGTNGKGSVSHMIASVLQQAGYKTGLYTSPHLLDLRERIKTNGQMISKAFVVDFVNVNQTFIQQLKPSFFEMMVMLAFSYFSQQQVDVAVIEVGMGGRLDSTNIITPELSVITNIGLDHTQFLGDTLNKIAAEKAGIIKPNIPVVIGETKNETKLVFEEVAKKQNCTIVYASEKYPITRAQPILNGLQVYLENKTGIETRTTDLSGIYQANNLRTSLCALELLKTPFTKISNETIALGLQNVISNTKLWGRWQTISTKPLIICDTGHNLDGLQYVTKQINQTKHNKLHLVLGLVSEKKASEVLSLFPNDATFYLTQPNIPRAMPVAQLALSATSHHLNFTAHNTVREAIISAQSHANGDDLIFIGGSTFVVADALELFTMDESLK